MKENENLTKSNLLSEKEIEEMLNMSYELNVNVDYL